MELYPAIDLFEGKAVRLLKGDYRQMTVYSDRPEQVAAQFVKEGARNLHLVDLEGAKTGGTPNLASIRTILNTTNLLSEVGGGIRSMETVKTYLSIGVGRVILGTAAVTDEAFLKEALFRYGDHIAVGVDLKDGYVAIKGWTERSALRAEAFFEKLEALGVQTVICTDISKDGAMQGANRALYQALSQRFSLRLIASGGVSSLEDIQVLKAMGLYGTIIGKAYYVGAVDLKEALEEAEK